MTLPQGWAEASFADIAKHKSGNSKLIKGKLEDQPGDGLFPAFSASGQDVWRDSFEQEGEAIIVSAVGARCGKAFRASGKWSAIANTHIVWPEADAADRDFLFLILNDEQFWEKGGTAQPFVKVGATFERKVDLPPLTEQRRIVAKLNALTARLARTRAELDRVPSLATQLIAKAYEVAFDCEGEMVGLASITPSDAPIIYGILQPGPDTPGGIPYVRPTEIDDGTIKLDELRRTTPAIASQYKRATIRSGDIILTIVGTIGKVAVVPSELDGGNITQSSCRIRPDREKIDPIFLRHWLQSPQAWQHYNSGRLGTAVPRLNLRDIREFTLRLPPISEQRRIGKELSAVVARADRFEAEATRARALLDRLETALLAKAFRGELVPQDPNEEPARTLLDRIRTQRAAAPQAKRGRRKAKPEPLNA